MEQAISVVGEMEIFCVEEKYYVNMQAHEKILGDVYWVYLQCTITFESTGIKASPGYGHVDLTMGNLILMNLCWESRYKGFETFFPENREILQMILS